MLPHDSYWNCLVFRRMVRWSHSIKLRSLCELETGRYQGNPMICLCILVYAYINLKKIHYTQWRNELIWKSFSVVWGICWYMWFVMNTNMQLYAYHISYQLTYEKHTCRSSGGSSGTAGSSMPTQKITANKQCKFSISANIKSPKLNF